MIAKTGFSVMVRRNIKFNPKRASQTQMRLHVDKTCKWLLNRAGGDLKKVNMKMVEAAARKQNIPKQEILDHLRSMKAK